MHNCSQGTVVTINCIDVNTWLFSVKGVQGIVCRLSDRIDRELLEAAGPQLKVVSTMSVGFDHIGTSIYICDCYLVTT